MSWAEELDRLIATALEARDRLNEASARFQRAREDVLTAIPEETRDAFEDGGQDPLDHDGRFILEACEHYARARRIAHHEALFEAHGLQVRRERGRVWVLDEFTTPWSAEAAWLDATEWTPADAYRWLGY